eukprot:COSAG01_NODE_2029_length_8590_cov_5.719501_5_plen_98_part_00
MKYQRRCGRSVALARVCYAAPSLALLDDPLSAVDAAVARRLWREAVRTEISLRFPYCNHRDKNRRRNGQKCMGISATALVLIMKYHHRGLLRGGGAP